MESDAKRWPLWLALGVVALAVAWHGLRPLAGLDVWWHVRLGEQIATTGSLVPTDIFSHTQAGAPWPWKDLGTALGLYALWQLGGPAALVVWQGLLYVATFGLLWLLLARVRKVPPALAVLMCVLALEAIAFRVSPRAASVSLVILLGVLVLIERHRRGESGLLWVIPLAVLNANIHRGVLVLPVLLAALTVAELAEDMVWARAGRRWRISGLAAIGSAVACLATPFGWALVSTTVELMGKHSPHITEWAPVQVDLVWMLTPASFAMIGLVIVGGFVRGFVARPRDPWDFALAAVAIGLGLGSMRHLPYLALLGAGPAAAGLALASGPWSGRLRHVIAVAAAFVGLSAQLARPLPAPALTIAPAHFPERGVGFVRGLPEDLALKGEMFNEFGYGGYLIYHLWPEHRVYIDGRTDLVYPPSAVSRYRELMDDPEAFALDAAALGIEWVFIDNSPRHRPRVHFDANPRWTLVHASRRTLIYVRNDGLNAALARARGYRWLWAHDLRGSFVAAATRGHGQQALDELRRMVAEDPENFHAAAGLAAVTEAQRKGPPQ